MELLTEEEAQDQPPGKARLFVLIQNKFATDMGQVHDLF